MKKRKCIIGILLILGISQIFAAPCGDVNSNGIIDIVDALMTAQYYVGLDPQPYDLAAADVSGDGNVNIVDALQTAQYYVGLLTTLAGCEQPPTDPPGTTPLPETITMQAEDADWDNGFVDTQHTGYTGTGFVDTTNVSGTWIEWSLNIANDTPAVCDFRYACASDTRSMNMSVNGGPAIPLTFPASGAWTTWAVEEAPTVNLNAGANTIRLTAATSGGAPNMDKMDITMNSIRVTPPPTEPPTPTPTPSPTPIGYTIPPIPPEGLIAFPGAEGYGKNATGGRGGSVYLVTTLNSSGSGSLGEALSASGPRTVVFRVGGTINGSFSISNNDITVAGQTAPGDGIAINGTLLVNANNTIIRYLRVRGKGSGDTITNNHNSPKHDQIYDHLSACWSSDEVFSVYFNEYITIQYCMTYEACSGNHQFGGIWGGNHNSMHHNLFAHNTSRNPRIASGSGYNDFRNNVIFNTRQPLHGGEKHEVGNDPLHVFQSCNVVANYMKPGPVNTSLHICGAQSRNGMNDAADWYVADNYLYGNASVTADNWKGVTGTYIKLSAPSEHMPIRQQTAEEAFLTVLADAGCSRPVRDSLDARVIEEARTGVVQNGNGLRSSPGSLPSLAGGTAPADSDNDGMPDNWENSNGLNPNDPNDRNNTDATGYTMLEKYINSLDSFPDV